MKDHYIFPFSLAIGLVVVVAGIGIYGGIMFLRYPTDYIDLNINKSCYEMGGQSSWGANSTCTDLNTGKEKWCKQLICAARDENIK